MNATASQPKKPRKPKKPQTRHVEFNAQIGAMFMTIDGTEFPYWLDRLGTDADGRRCYRLTKFVAIQQPEEPNDYDVAVSQETSACSCECKGFLRHRKCKHVACLLALIAAGKLS